MVECRTPEREVRGSRPTAAVLCPWARHFTPRKYWLITQEAMAPSRHDWKIVDWDVKPQHNQPTFFKLAGNEDTHKISDEFEFQPDWITDYRVSCLEVLKISCRLIMGKLCLHASSFIFDRIVITVAGNQDRHKSSDEFNFRPLVSMVHYMFSEMRACQVRLVDDQKICVFSTCLIGQVWCSCT